MRWSYVLFGAGTLLTGIGSTALSSGGIGAWVITGIGIILFAVGAVVGLRERRWEEFDRFTDHAFVFWETLSGLYAEFPGGTLRRSGLKVMVGEVGWPDDEQTNAAGEFADSIYPLYGQLSEKMIHLDDSRRAMMRIVREWGRHIWAVSCVKRGFLNRHVRPAHKETVILLWYLERSLARRIGTTEALQDDSLDKLKALFEKQPPSPPERTLSNEVPTYLPD